MVILLCLMSQKIQGFKKIALKSSIISIKKDPWVPPPAKTTKRIKNVQSKTVLPLEPNYYPIIDAKALTGDVGEKDFSKYACKLNTPIEHNIEDTERAANIKEMEADLESSDKNSAGNISQELYSLRKTIQLLEHHFYSIQTFLLLLQRALKLVLPEGEAVNDIVTITEQCIHECNVAFFQMKSSFEVIEERNTADSDIPEVCASLLGNKDLVITKLLEGYENIASALQLVLRHIDRSGLAALNIEQESLKKTVENLQSNYVSREVRIQELENQLSLSQGQVNSLQKQKRTLEDTRTSLLKELSKKGSEMEDMKAELQKFQIRSSGQKPNERLIEIMEELKLKFEAEKEALKKAVRMHKLHADQSEEIIQRLKKKLHEKENLVYHIAAERDEWKVKVTVTSNKLVEAENEIANLKGRTQKLQNTLQEEESFHQSELSKLIGVLNEKASLLEGLSKQNENFKKSQNFLEERCSETENELKNLQRKYNEISDVLHTRSGKEQKGAELPSDIEDLTTLLKDLREQLAVTKKFNEHILQEKSSNERMSETNTEGNLLLMIQEFKEQICRAKEVFVQDKEKDAEITALREQVQSLEEKYAIATGENLKFVARLEGDEKRTPCAGISGDNLHSKIQIADFNWNSSGKLSEAGHLLHKFAKNNEDFLRQVKELRDKLCRQEQLNDLKISKLEDDLHAREMELSTIKMRDKDEEERRLKRMQDLQESLDEANANNQRLQKYVEFLKNSYINVFGKP